jgi:nitrogen fixation NifU-like protein
MFTRFHDLVTGKLAEADAKDLGSLRAFGGVSKFPLRVKCASLAWHTLHSALHGEGKTVSTEGEGPTDMLEGA